MSARADTNHKGGPDGGRISPDEANSGSNAGPCLHDGSPSGEVIRADSSPATPGLRRMMPRVPMARRGRTYGALDLGTNNCRLLIARPGPQGFVIVDAYSRVVRLGEGLMESGRLSDAAMDRTVAALAACAEKLARRDVRLTRNVATEACRRAANGNRFVDRVFEETGIALDVISAAEEARLAVLGCHMLIAADGPPALVFDIGGGSTEVMLVAPGSVNGGEPEIIDWISMPWGVVSLAETEPQWRDAPDRALAYAPHAGKGDIAARWLCGSGWRRAASGRGRARCSCSAHRAPSPRWPASRWACRPMTAASSMARWSTPRRC